MFSVQEEADEKNLSKEAGVTPEAAEAKGEAVTTAAEETAPTQTVDSGENAAAETGGETPAPEGIESITEAELRKVIETILFITDKPVPLGKICAVAEVNNSDFAQEVIKKIQKEYLESGSSVQILEVGGGYQMSTKPEFGRWVRRLYGERMSAKLSAAALETLAIVAYRQPITRAEVESVRGVDVIAPLETLIERGIVKVVGRKETIGRPLLYGTTAEFLRLFGLSGLKDLPTLESFGIDTSSLEENRQPELFELPDNNAEGLTAELARAVAEDLSPAEPETELEAAAARASAETAAAEQAVPQETPLKRDEDGGDLGEQYDAPAETVRADVADEYIEQPEAAGETVRADVAEEDTEK